MPVTKTFEYQTVDRDGKRAKGTLEAANEAAAAQHLRQQGLTPVSITEGGSLLKREITIPGLGSRTTLKDLAVFARQFATMTASGMSLMRSLAVLEDQATKTSLKKAISEVRMDVEGGISLSGALGKHPKVFPTLMVALVRAGETGGFLDNALERIAVNFEKDAALRGKIKGAMTYPVIVLVFTGFLVAGVLAFIVPVFEGMFKQFGGELPLPTQILVTASHSLAWSGPLFVAVLVGSTMLFRRELRRRQPLRLAFDKLKLRLPVFGKLFGKIAISRFSRNLGTLLGAGVPVMQAIDVVGATTGSEVIAEAMKDLQSAVRDGLPMSTQLAKHPVFPRMVAQMIEVGEESGQISQMLDKVADFYDREVDTAAESLTAAIEPLMVIVMGVVVGGMVVCLYLPMFTIYQNIQN
ncbi:type II secretion system F family protein [Planomonospora venezuelensis]|uniref:Type IV pilus assembly protein PilC n=1 Tax=Planomonospora venezuelensis TaxID=1999 RepID=A0A841DD52_PLAVE|nr:type II secretion system F family protein [Planomonospora venezuelensis]MBB5966713.1 type IV pilus assembly protein PilC [Planomonospora venezuelensis]GIN00316.1 phytochrome sensor protein [Planomonospora venezuelensis]